MAAVNQARAAVAIAYASDGLLQAQRLRRSDRSAQNDEEARQLLVNVVRRLQSSAANSPQLPVARRLLREVEQDIHRRNTAEDRRADPRDEALSGRIQFGLRLRHLGSLRRVLNELAESELRGDLPLPEAAKLATAQQSEIASNRTRTRPPSAGFAAKPRRRHRASRVRVCGGVTRQVRVPAARSVPNGVHPNRNATYVEIPGSDHMVFYGAALPITMGLIDEWIARNNLLSTA